MIPIKNTGCYSFVKGEMAEGCKYCVKGQKLVLFITGLCGLKCFYCPVSEKKMYKDMIYANEWKIEKKEDVLEEARLTKAKGAGITGGDPLIVTDRVCEYIEMLKKEFSKKFHIHLYSSLHPVTKDRLKKLYDAGLDEIRFHPQLDDKTLWPKLLLAKKFDWNVGVEIPCIPNKKKEILELISYVQDKVDFLNLNELELSEKNYLIYEEKGFVTKNDLSYAIKGSAELAMEILKEVKTPINLYFCTSKLKNGVQMKNRMKRRAKSIKKSFDVITGDGTIIRGIIYLSELTPSFGYRDKLNSVNKTELVKKLKLVRKELINNFDLSEDCLIIDELKLRLITDKVFLKKNVNALKKLKLIPAIVEEYPTRDATEMEIDFL